MFEGLLRLIGIGPRQQPEPLRSAREEMERHRPLSAAELEQRAKERDTETGERDG